MSSEQPGGKKRTFFARILPATVAGKAAAVTAIVLTLSLLTVWLIRWLGSQRVAFDHALTWSRMLIELALVVAIPIILYWGLRLWNQVIEGVYPDIDAAWQAGVEALRAQGVSLADQPIYLILGSSDSEFERNMITALEEPVRVQGVPTVAGLQHALQWYASPQAIYLFCPGSSALSSLMGRWANGGESGEPRIPSPAVGGMAVGGMQEYRSARAESTTREPGRPDQSTAVKQTPESPSGPKPTEPSRRAPSTQASQSETTAKRYGQGTISAAHMLKPPPSSAQEADRGGQQQPVVVKTSRPLASEPVNRPTGTLSHLESGSERPPTRAGVDDAAKSAEPPEKRGNASHESPHGHGPHGPATKEVEPAAADQVDASVEGPTVASHSHATATTPLPRLAASKLALPDSLDTSDQIPRLKYVCKLLRRSRLPRCGINGVVTLIPFELSRVGPMQLSAIAQSARGDIEAIQEVVGVRAPVTALLVGLEQDRGFKELVRRLPSELLSRRLGGRFDLRARPTPDELNTYSDLLCDTFEDWVYRLFGRDDALSQQRGNRKLYELTSRIRHQLKPRLRIVLGEAFGCDVPAKAEEPTQEGSKSDSALLFSGCYFAASGERNGPAAFVKGVLRDKLLQEQSRVEWMPHMLRRYQIFRALAVLGWIVSGLLGGLLLTRWLV